MEDLIEAVTRGNVAEVKIVLASVALALGCYQLVVIAVAYRWLRPPFLDADPAGTAHRAVGDAIAIILLLVGVSCLTYYGFEDDKAAHAYGGSALLAVLAAKIAVVRRGGPLGRMLPVFGLTVFSLLTLTWATSAGEFVL